MRRIIQNTHCYAPEWKKTVGKSRFFNFPPGAGNQPRKAADSAGTIIREPLMKSASAESEDSKEPLNKSSSAECRIFCPIRTVQKVGNTYSIPPLFELSAVPKSLDISSCRFSQRFPNALLRRPCLWTRAPDFSRRNPLTASGIDAIICPVVMLRAHVFPVTWAFSSVG